MSAHQRSVVIHGHFYQPPRENPWLDEVEAEASAAPFHDWNERIERECYRAVVAARVLAPDGRIARIVNTLAWLSFDIGPTLLGWLERAAPDTYAAILAADRRSAERLGGYGNAIAMPYHHTILPLSSRRDKVTEVRWGLADFRRRFGRAPQGMWLPEAAVDHETLDVLAHEGIAFTILGPTQVERLPAGGRPGRYRATGGRELAVFVYDGPISHDVAFGPLMRDAAAWLERLVPRGASDDRSLISLATDGETYGHHHRFGEMALAALLDGLARRPDVRVENYASFLARHPPTEDITLVAPSSWSCAHGVERWRADCGCKVAPDTSTQQRWRAPLREALEWLAHELALVFEADASELLQDPWAARDAYGNAMHAEPERSRFVDGRLTHPADHAHRTRALELLEMQRDALRMFTSCGWFFDDLAGLEPLQVLRYAAHGIELSGPAADRLEAGIVERLAAAVSNDAQAGTGRDLYLRRVKPATPVTARVAAAYAAARALGASHDEASVAAYEVHADDGGVTLVHRRTGRRTSLRVAVDRREGAPLTATVTADGAGPLAFTVDHLPERPRRFVVRALRAVLAERWLSPEERAAVARGEQGLEDATRVALERAVAALEQDVSDEAAARIAGLADLLELLGRWVPFDIQTRFDRLRQTMPADRRRALAALAHRLGFAPDA